MQGPLLASLLLMAGPLAAQMSVPTIRLGAPAIQMGGGSEPNDETLLSGVIGATRLPNGTIVIGDGAFPRILMFTGRGQFQRAPWAQGEGPGELQMPRWAKS